MLGIEQSGSLGMCLCQFYTAYASWTASGFRCTVESEQAERKTPLGFDVLEHSLMEQLDLLLLFYN
jgi:hypothetical protein